MRQMHVNGIVNQFNFWFISGSPLFVPVQWQLYGCIVLFRRLGNQLAVSIDKYQYKYKHEPPSDLCFSGFVFLGAHVTWIKNMNVQSIVASMRKHDNPYTTPWHLTPWELADHATLLLPFWEIIQFLLGKRTEQRLEQRLVTTVWPILCCSGCHAWVACKLPVEAEWSRWFPLHLVYCRRWKMDDSRIIFNSQIWLEIQQAPPIANKDGG